MIKGLTTSENTGKMREREKEKEKEVNKNVMSGNRTDVGSGGIRLGGNGGNGQREEIEMMDRRMRFTTAVGLGRVEEEKKKYRVSGVESIDQAIKAAQSSRLLLAAHTAQGALTVQGAHTIQGAQGTQTAQGQQISP